MLSFEAKYRREALETRPNLLGLGMFKFWVGRFYVGLWGLIAIVAIFCGAGAWFWRVVFRDPNKTGNFLLNFIRGQVEVPLASVGARIPLTEAEGFWWFFIVMMATIAFFSWMMRQADISRQLKMGYQVPVAYGAVFSSWVTIQIVRPLLLGHWSEGFPLGVIAHLDWLSTFGYRFYNFYYNPFHALGVALLFGSGFILALHGATILSAAGPSKHAEGVTEDNVNTFYWEFFGYSIGEVGVHRLSLYAGVFCVLISNLCLVLSGTLVQDWSGFWNFWNKMPFWSGFGF
jgi:photosynthetic reaction center L subunit